MAKHAFGIMQTAPKPGEWYVDYEPRKYRCLFVRDDHVEKVVADWCGIDGYWHTLDAPAKGLAYTGITLIPPDSLPAWTALIQDTAEWSGLKELLGKAFAEGKWIIHFGI
jgi:hypothetical protein